jgi:hypothetical protein
MCCKYVNTKPDLFIWTGTDILVALPSLMQSREIKDASYLQLLPSMLTSVILFSVCLYLSIVYPNTLSAQTMKWFICSLIHSLSSLSFNETFTLTEICPDFTQSYPDSLSCRIIFHRVFFHIPPFVLHAHTILSITVQRDSAASFKNYWWFNNSCNFKILFNIITLYKQYALNH